MLAARAGGDIMRHKTIAVFAGLLLALFASAARAEGTENLLHPWGMSLSAGAGVNDFVGEDLRDMTTTGGAWDARFTFGTRQYVGFEAAYLGSVQEIDAIGMEENAVLVSNGIEGSVRIQVPTGIGLYPYAFGGAAWKRYDLANTDTNTSDVSESDDVLEIPAGIGVAYNYKGLLVDVRGAYRFAVEEDLVPAADGDGASTLDNFNVSAHLGIEF
jgi:hypothetical protein